MTRSWIILLVSLLCAGATASGQWIAQESNLPADVRAYRISAVNDKVVWAGGQRDFLAPSADFSRTIDGGAHWLAGTIPLPSDFFILNISAIDADTAWAAAGSFHDSERAGIYKTVDGGKTWLQQLTVSPFPSFVYFFNDREGLTFKNLTERNPRNYLTIFTTSDCGATWRGVPEKDNIRLMELEGVSHSAYTVDGDYFYAPTSAGRILKSSDHGKSWALIATGADSSFIWPSFKDPRHALAAVSAMKQHFGMRRTGDAGTSWEHIPTPDFLAFSPASIPGTGGGYLLSSCGWGLGKTGSAFTMDNGTSWTMIDDVAHLWIEMVSRDLGWSGDGNSNTIYQWRIGKVAPIGCYPQTGIFFEPTRVGSVSATRILAITNFGQAPLILTSITAQGPHFRLNGPAALPVTLQTFETLRVEVHFTPTEPMRQRADLTLESNAPDSPQYRLLLEGEGIADARMN